VLHNFYPAVSVTQFHPAVSVTQFHPAASVTQFHPAVSVTQFLIFKPTTKMSPLYKINKLLIELRAIQVPKKVF